MKYSEKAARYYLSTGKRFHRQLLWALGAVKYAAAWANMELGVLEEEKAKAIMGVAREIMQGLHHEEITVDVFQTGSGTGLNMNVNELIAVKAGERGIRLHPNDDVNRSQSSNDVIPTAVRLAAIREALAVEGGVKRLVSKLYNLAEKYRGLVKPGRTHLRDALPVTLGFEFEAYAEELERTLGVLSRVVDNLRFVPLGGTAVGTGANAPEGYDKVVVGLLSNLTGIGLVPAKNKSSRMKLISDLQLLASSYKALAGILWRLSQDLRLMYSGPYTGIGEIDMEIEVAGSSIMPGKKNPVTLEAIMQASTHIAGLEQSLSQASLLGEFELSMAFPLASHVLHEMYILLVESLDKMVMVLDSVKPLEERMKSLALRSPALVTYLSPLIGYDRATKVAERVARGESLGEALEKEGFDPGLADEVLSKIPR